MNNKISSVRRGHVRFGRTRIGLDVGLDALWPNPCGSVRVAILTRALPLQHNPLTGSQGSITACDYVTIVNPTSAWGCWRVDHAPTLVLVPDAHAPYCGHCPSVDHPRLQAVVSHQTHQNVPVSEERPSPDTGTSVWN